MRRCAFSTNNNTTGTSDLTAPSRGRLFFNVRPASAYRAAFGNPPSRAADFIRSRPERSRPQATNGRSAKKKRSLCLHPDSTAGGPHRPPKQSAHGDRPCRIEDLPSPIRHIAPHATETRRLPVVPARRAAFPRRCLPTDFRQAAAARATMPVGSASDEYRPATAPDKKRAEEYSSSARSDPAGRLTPWVRYRSRTAAENRPESPSYRSSSCCRSTTIRPRSTIRRSCPKRRSRNSTW